ncbi:MAG: hypothetical protein ACXV45_05320 [Halobacteriota archaeon]
MPSLPPSLESRGVAALSSPTLEFLVLVFGIVFVVTLVAGVLERREM